MPYLGLCFGSVHRVILCFLVTLDRHQGHCLSPLQHLRHPTVSPQGIKKQLVWFGWFGLVYYLGWVVAVAGGGRDRRTAGSPRRRLSDRLSSGLGWTPEPQAGRALDIFRIRSSERD